MVVRPLTFFILNAFPIFRQMLTHIRLHTSLQSSRYEYYIFFLKNTPQMRSINYLTTIFTNLLGTTITLTIVLPSVYG